MQIFQSIKQAVSCQLHFQHHHHLQQHPHHLHLFSALNPASSPNLDQLNHQQLLASLDSPPHLQAQAGRQMESQSPPTEEERASPTSSSAASAAFLLHPAAAAAKSTLMASSAAADGCSAAVGSPPGPASSVKSNASSTQHSRWEHERF
jgi:hypothetical protein